MDTTEQVVAEDGAPLLERGMPSIYRKSRGELSYIGMPVGGIGCGLLYLGGDGKLWLWDIFNLPKEGVLLKTVDVPLMIWGGGSTVGARDGAAYVAPHRQVSPLVQGFCLRVNGSEVRSLDASDWEEVTFLGQYPIGTVTYSDPACPVKVVLEAFSPFIPLNLPNSSLPATILQFTLTNNSDEPVTAELAGFLENAVGLYSAKTSNALLRRMNIVKDGVLCCGLDNATGLEQAHDVGSMAITCLEATRATAAAPLTAEALPVFDDGETTVAYAETAESPLIGAVERQVRLAPGASTTVSFIIAWHFPNNPLDVPDAQAGNHYATRFTDASDVVAYIQTNFDQLTSATKLWRDTWYDSTLPYWFLDRTFANVSTLATTTFFRFGTGRFWAWEGVGCCPGTCTHVWHYAQAPSRLFPEIERDLRERIDFGSAFDENTGIIGYRGENTGAAVDGQCGRILGVWREHQMNTDGMFLQRIWHRVKAALEYLMRHDTDNDGILDGAQENTLDAAWYGKIAWLSSLYAAALRAGNAMAREVGDSEFADRCAQCAATTQAAIESQLFNGEYFIQKPEPGRESALGTYKACYIDQVHGQSWAWQVGLGRVLDAEKTVTALKSLYRYNFMADVGPFRAKNRPGRPYALPGEAGLIMATNPKELSEPFGNPVEWQYGYFNECMSGFEHQAASHMIAEGLVTEGMTVIRAIHDRYHAAKRNPYNEVECSDHYARAMASYGSFVTICGFEYHGPRGHLAFAPRYSPNDFRAAFTTAEGWGTFTQTSGGATISIRWGKLRLKSLGIAATESVELQVGGKHIPADYVNGIITLNTPLVLTAGQVLEVAFVAPQH